MSGGPALEEQIEKARRRMEEAANHLGLDHPQVYELSRELDELHNLWEQETFLTRREGEIFCTLSTPVRKTAKRSNQTMVEAI